ncbi:MAG: kynurenine formamidase, partial [Gemmatimonadales bacterium]
MGRAASDVTVALYDLTPRITPRLGVWPGDTVPSREVLLDLARGDSVTLSTLHATVHLGAHADAPSHYGEGASAIESRSLEMYLGRCQVMHVRAARGQRLQVKDLVLPVTAPRLLIGTGTFPDAERYNTDFAALSPELVEHLHTVGVRLV